MQIPIEPEVIKKITEYICATQTFADSQAALQTKNAELEGKVKTLEKSAKARETISAIADLLVESSLVTKEQRDALVEKIATDATAAKEVFSGILRARGLVQNKIGSGIDDPATKVSSAGTSADEFDTFVNS